MLIDRKHMPWAVGSAVVAAASVSVYWMDSAQRGPTMGRYGSTPLGLAFGIAGLLVMLFLAGLSAKRKAPTLRLGRAQTWLRGHIWLGLLLVLFVALHAAFRAGGQLTIALWVLLGLITASGVFGLILQQTLPRLMLYSLPGETIAQQLEREKENLVTLAEGLVKEFAGSLDQPAPPYVESPAATPAPAVAAETTGTTTQTAMVAVKPMSKPVAPRPPMGGEPLRLFYLQRVAPYLRGDASGQALKQPELFFHALRIETPEHIHPGIESLRELCLRREELLKQQRMMRVLLGWLIVHVPLSWSLLLLTVIHAVVALRFG